MQQDESLVAVRVLAHSVIKKICSALVSRKRLGVVPHIVAPPNGGPQPFDHAAPIQLTFGFVVAIAHETRMREVRTVLLVEDFPPLLKRWTRELQHAGKRVLAANNGDVAMELVRETKPDIAIVDLFLAAENGVNVIRKLRELDRDCYAILVSAHMSVAYAIAAMRAGADDVFFKPGSLKYVIECVEKGVALEPPPEMGPTLEQLEWEHISRVLLDCENNITHAAERLGIYRQTLQRKLRKYMPRS
jgi:two-component system response regulator RegA